MVTKMVIRDTEDKDDDKSETCDNVFLWSHCKWNTNNGCGFEFIEWRVFERVNFIGKKNQNWL